MASKNVQRVFSCPRQSVKRGDETTIMPTPRIMYVTSLTWEDICSQAKRCT